MTGCDAVGLADDGRDPRRVPENWREFVDPDEWVLNREGLPARRAARVIVLRRTPRPAILLAIGHDAADAGRLWAFTPGGGILPREGPKQGALRELAEETGVHLTARDLVGPVVDRSARLDFDRITCRQEELFYLARLDARGVGRADAARGEDGQMDRSGWTAAEHEVLDSLRWWPLDELDAAAGAGMTVYPAVLPALARSLLAGWDGRLRVIREED